MQANDKGGSQDDPVKTSKTKHTKLYIVYIFYRFVCASFISFVRISIRNFIKAVYSQKRIPLLHYFQTTKTAITMWKVLVKLSKENKTSIAFYFHHFQIEFHIQGRSSMYQHPPKPYEKLQLQDDFMFSKIMHDPKYCKPFLETILGIRIHS